MTRAKLYKKCPQCGYLRRFEDFQSSFTIEGLGTYRDWCNECVRCRTNTEECDLCHEFLDKSLMKKKDNVRYCVFCEQGGTANILRIQYKKAVKESENNP